MATKKQAAPKFKLDSNSRHLHAMVDIETMSTEKNAVVLTLGVAIFSGDCLIINDRELVLPARPQLLAGRHVDPDTIAWWAKQSDQAKEAAFLANSRHNVEDPLEAFLRMIEPCRTVWADSPSFDLVIVQSLCKDFGVDVPWTHRDERDLRTYKAAVPHDVKDVPRGDLVPHIAKDDAIHQVAVLKACAEHIGVQIQ